MQELKEQLLKVKNAHETLKGIGPFVNQEANKMLCSIQDLSSAIGESLLIIEFRIKALEDRPINNVHHGWGGRK